MDLVSTATQRLRDERALDVAEFVGDAPFLRIGRKETGGAQAAGIHLQRTLRHHDARGQRLRERIASRC